MESTEKRALNCLHTFTDYIIAIIKNGHIEYIFPAICDRDYYFSNWPMHCTHTHTLWLGGRRAARGEYYYYYSRRVRTGGWSRF